MVLVLVSALGQIFSSSILAQERQIKTFYVSPNGKDNWPGSLKKPFKALSKAKEAVIRHVDTSSNSDVTVYLREGNYFLEHPLTFKNGENLSGSNTISFKAFQDENPILTGGKEIKGWTLDKNGIYKADCKGLDFRQLYINGKRAVRARQPNNDEFTQLIGWDLKGRSLIVDGNQIKAWNNFKHVQAVIQMYWAEAIVNLESFEQFKGGTNHAYVKLNDRQSDILFPRPYPQKQDNAFFHFENAYEFLDEYGEWYLDLDKEILYYKPSPDEKIETLNIVAPVTEQLIHIEGTIEQPVTNLTFEGLTFENTNWNLPNTEGFINAQAGMYNLSATEENYQTVRRPPSTVHIENARHIAISKNLFRNLGSTAIDLVGGTKDCRISGNLISSIAGNGIMAGAFSAVEDGEYHEPYNPTDLREIGTDDEISNNYIGQTGRDYYGTCAIAAGYVAGLKILHNTIEDSPYSGISLGYGWTSEKNALRDNLVAYNDIGNVMNVLCDGAGIYTLSLQPGTIIKENYIHDIKRSPWAGAWPVSSIYLDEQSGGTEEKPMVLERNCLPSDKSILRWNFHRAGIFLMKNNSRYFQEDVAQKAGIEKEHKENLEKMLKR